MQEMGWNVEPKSEIKEQSNFFLFYLTQRVMKTSSYNKAKAWHLAQGAETYLFGNDNL